MREEARAFYAEWRRRSRQSPPVSLPQAALLALVCVLAVAFTAMFFDAQIARAARDLPRWVRDIFGLITLIGASGYIFAFSAFTALMASATSRTVDDLRMREGLRLLAGRALVVFAVAATSGIASQILKHLIGRARPRLMDQLGPFHFDPMTFKAVQASFPSGHTITAFAIAWTLGLFLPKRRIALFSLAVLVALSRVVLGSHYPGDVVAGAAIGIAAAWVTCRAFAARRLVLDHDAGGIVPRGRGLVLPALRAFAGAGKARA